MSLIVSPTNAIPPNQAAPVDSVEKTNWAATTIQKVYKGRKVRLNLRTAKLAMNLELARSKPGMIVEAKDSGMSYNDVYDAILKVAKVFNQFERGFVEPHDYVDEDYFNGAVVPGYRSPENILLAMVENKVVGFLITAKRKEVDEEEPYDKFTCPADTGFLAYLAVDSQKKKSGLGTKLMLDAIIKTKELGKRYLKFDYLVGGRGVKPSEGKARVEFYNNFANRFNIPYTNVDTSNGPVRSVVCTYDLQHLDLDLVKKHYTVQ